MERTLYDLEDSCEDHHVERFTVSCSLRMEHTQLVNRQRGVLFPHTLVERAVLPRGSCEMSIRRMDLTQGWSGGLGVQNLDSDFVASTAPFTFTSKCITPWMNRPRVHPEAVVDAKPSSSILAEKSKDHAEH